MRYVGANRAQWVSSGCKVGGLGGQSGYQVDRKNPPPRGGFLFTIFSDQELCVREFTARCDGRSSSRNLLHMDLDQGT